MLGKALTTAAAGNAAGEGTYVEEVFSTYLYEGNTGIQGIENSIKLGDFGVGTSTQFYDSSYLQKSSDLTGNSDGKTFTLSAWIKMRQEGGSQDSPRPLSNSSGRFNVFGGQGSGGSFSFTLRGSNTSGTIILNATTSSKLGGNDWCHLLVSIDLSDTSKRYIYINGVLDSSVTWTTYTNDNIDFTDTTWRVNTTGGSDAKYAHIYLDYTYRDLSVEANRLNFIDSNGGSTSPSTLSALSPILYLPMTDAYTIGKNLGTGGDFTANGSPTIVQDGTEYVVDSGNGGLVWIKNRTGTWDHALFDTERGVSSYVKSNSNSTSATTQFSSFNSNGFSLNGGNTRFNDASSDYVSWTFAKAPKFFDVVTYTGNGVQGRTISHNLGSTPGMIMVKSLSNSYSWHVLHRDMTAASYAIYLDLTYSEQPNWNSIWNSTFPSSTEFTLGSNGAVNENGDNYVAYLFAHNDGDGDFGETGDQDIIKCGSYTGAGSGAVDVDLGFEPQFVFIKNASRASDWMLQDIMRGMSHGSWNPLVANKTQAEIGISADRVVPTATGFTVNNNGSNDFGQSGDTVIYIAIRRGPMKTPTSGTEVFATDIRTSAEGEGKYTSGFPVDWSLANNYDEAGNTFAGTRLTNAHLQTNSTTTESSSASDYEWDYNDGISIGASGAFFGSSKNIINYMFRRAPGFFDVVAYTGNSTAGRTVSHNLEVTPEMIWVKRRNGSDNWGVYHKGLNGGTTPENYYLNLDRNAEEATQVGYWNNTAPTSSNFTLGTNPRLNDSAGTYIAYLFATLPGISKVGSYTGNGTSQAIDCGFSAGARFVLIKRTDGTGNWNLFDSERGIVAGNDPRLELNTTDAEDTGYDWIDPDSSGFIVNHIAYNADCSNHSGATYIFLAIA